MLNNFVIDSPSREFGIEVMKRAEDCRKFIAKKWLGRELLPRQIPCLVFVAADTKPYGQVYYQGKRVDAVVLRGTPKEILSGILPHEVAHTVLYQQFGDDFPLWAHEGIAIGAEANSPSRFNGHFGNIPLHQLFGIKVYPTNWPSYYGQSYLVTKFFVERLGEQRFVKFAAFCSEYSYNDACYRFFLKTLYEVQNEWDGWYEYNSPTKGNAGLSLRGYG